MGLNLNVPDTQLNDRVLREHRNRVWWTAYELDRLFAATQSQPASIRDDEIQVDLPSDAGLPSESRGDFTDANDLSNRIKLVRLTSQVTMMLYGRKSQNISFSQRVQQALKDLQDWSQKVEGHMQAGEQPAWRATSEPMKSLLLSFNQVSLYLFMCQYLGPR
jgi:proline utilization trans-activator